MSEYHNLCYIDSSKKIIKPIPEKNIVLLEYKEELWKKLFDNTNLKINIEKLQVSNIGIYSITKKTVRIQIKDIIKRSYKFLNLKDKLKDLVITDSNGGNGGITIYFSV